MTAGDAFDQATGAAVTEGPALPMLNHRIQRAHLEGVQRLLSLDAVSEVSSGWVDDSIAAPGQAHVFEASGDEFATEPSLREEVFGSSSVVVRRDAGEFAVAAASLEGQLTATLHAAESDHPRAAELLPVLEDKVGRIVFNGWPTGVEVGPRHGPRRALPRDLGRAQHLGRHPGHRALPAAGRLPGRPGRAAPGRARDDNPQGL